MQGVMWLIPKAMEQLGSHFIRKIPFILIAPFSRHLVRESELHQTLEFGVIQNLFQISSH